MLCISTFVLPGSFREFWLHPCFVISGLMRNLEWADADDLYSERERKD